MTPPPRNADSSSKLGRRRPTAAGDTPRDMFKKTTLCRFHSSRSGCERGTACPFAHGTNEMRSKPNLAKTSLCKLWIRGRCPSHSSECQWAHGRHELQSIRTEAGEPDQVSLAYEDDFAVGCSDGDAKTVASCRSSSKGGSAADAALDAFGSETPGWTSGFDSADEDFCKTPPVDHQDVQKECPRCNLCSNSCAARFCVRCGHTLVESSGTPKFQDGPSTVAPAPPPAMPIVFGEVESGMAKFQDGPSGMAAPMSPTMSPTMPVVFGGEAGAVMQAPWPANGGCTPGTVFFMPAAPQGQQWMVVPAASFTNGGVPVMVAVAGCAP